MSLRTAEDFFAFLDRIAAGEASVEDWNQYAIAQYADLQLESARRRLIRASLSIGHCSAIPYPPALQLVAEQLRSELRN